MINCNKRPIYVCDPPTYGALLKQIEGNNLTGEWRLLEDLAVGRDNWRIDRFNSARAQIAYDFDYVVLPVDKGTYFLIHVVSRYGNFSNVSTHEPVPSDWQADGYCGNIAIYASGDDPLELMDRADFLLRAENPLGNNVGAAADAFHSGGMRP